MNQNSLSFREKMRLVMANLSSKERLLLGVSVVFVVLGIFGGLVTISNAYTTLVPDFGGTYREGIVGSPRFINPVLATSDADRDLTSLVYSGLVRIDADGTIIPDLASSWTISPDQKTYSFTLKPHIFFQDGKPVTTNDIAFTVSKIQDPNLKSPVRVAWDGVQVSSPDPQTVVFTLQKPYAGFISQLTLGILPAHIWNSIADENWQTSVYNTEPIGSGPYRVKNVNRSRIGIPQNYVLYAFSRFALGKPFIGKFIITSFANQTDAYDAFKGGSIDGLAMVNSGDIDSIKTSTTNVLTKPLPRVFGIFLNPSKNSVLGDPTVITALNLGIDKHAIIDSVFKGYATPLDGPLPQSVDTTTTDFPTQQKLANQLLDKAGWKLNPTTNIREKTVGKTKEQLSFSLSTANTPELESTAQLIADQYAAIGVHIDVKIFEIGNLNENIIRGRDFESLLFGEVIKHDTDIFAFWHSSQKVDPGLNITGYTNKTVDALLEQALKEPAWDQRFNLYQKITLQLKKDAPVVFLYTPDFIYLINQRVHHATIPPILGSESRFSLVYQWYIRTDRVWNFFIKP